MPAAPPSNVVRLFFVGLSLHTRWALSVYMVVKGIRWAARNNLSLVLVVAILCAAVEALLAATFVSAIVLSCTAHLAALYATWLVYTVLLDGVLYYRAWCIAGRRSRIQQYASVFLALGHAGCLAVDAVYSIAVTYDTPATCVTIPGWPRSLFGLWSTANDLAQAVFFCIPLLRAVKSGANVSRDVAAYRRMITKSFVCLACCTIFNLTYVTLVLANQPVASVIFSDMALLFQILSACEIQFNSHRETDKASLGALIYQSPVNGKFAVGNQPMFSETTPGAQIVPAMPQSANNPIMMVPRSGQSTPVSSTQISQLV